MVKKKSKVAHYRKSPVRLGRPLFAPLSSRSPRREQQRASWFAAIMLGNIAVPQAPDQCWALTFGAHSDTPQRAVPALHAALLS